MSNRPHVEQFWLQCCKVAVDKTTDLGTCRFMHSSIVTNYLQHMYSVYSDIAVRCWSLNTFGSRRLQIMICLMILLTSTNYLEYKYLQTFISRYVSASMRCSCGTSKLEYVDSFTNSAVSSFVRCTVNTCNVN